MVHELDTVIILDQFHNEIPTATSMEWLVWGDIWDSTLWN